MLQENVELVKVLQTTTPSLGHTVGPRRFAGFGHGPPLTKDTAKRINEFAASSSAL